MKKNLKKSIVLKALYQYKWHVLITIVVNFAGHFFLCYSTVIFKNLIDSIESLSHLNEIIPVVAFFILLNLLEITLSYLDEYPFRVLDTGLYQWAKVQAIKKISHIDYQSYNTLGTGNLIQRIENGATAVKDIGFFYLRIFTELLPAVLLNLFFIAYFDGFIFKIIIGVYMIIFITSFFLLKYLKAHQEKILTVSEKFSRFSLRALMEMVVFRVNLRFKAEINKIDRIGKKITDATVKKRMLHEFFFFFVAILTLIIESGVIIMEIHKIILGVSSIGLLYALKEFTGRIIGPIAIFNVIFVDYQIDKVTLRKFYDFLDLPNDPNTENKNQLEVSNGTINMENVSFTYEENPVLSDFSLQVEGGTTVAIVGSSGSGKSTIAKLILSLLKPQRGGILIDSQNLASCNTNSIYRHLSYISQDAPVFDGTIRENLDFDKEFDDSILLYALEKTQLRNSIERLQFGLDTEIGERGICLSGGERQRLAIARLFLQKPKIIILDEPTAAMDSITEHFITRQMSSLFEDSTMVVIAHRLQTIKQADRIIVLEKGEICQEGDFENLVNNPGKFKELWEKQTENRIDDKIILKPQL